MTAGEGVRRRSAAESKRLPSVPPLRGLLPLVLVLAIWELVQREQSPYVPRPSLWVHAVAELWREGVLAPAVVATLKTFALSLTVATVLGAIIGVVVGRSRFVDRLSGPLLDYCRVMPAAAVVPLAVLFAGYTENMKVAVVVFSAIWPILLQVRQSARLLSPDLLGVARSLQLSRLATARKIYFPSLLPAVFLGLRVAAPTVLVIVLLVEITTVVPGVGAQIARAQQNFDTASAYGLVCVVGILALLVNALISLLEGYVLRYRPQRS